MECKACPAAQMFDVFGIQTDKICCYKYMDYCENIIDCNFKILLNKQQLTGVPYINKILSVKQARELVFILTKELAKYRSKQISDNMP